MRIPQNYKYYFIFLISNSHFLCSHIIHLAFEHLYDCDYSSTDRLIYVTSPVQLFFTIYMCLFNILLYTFCYHIAYKLNMTPNIIQYYSQYNNASYFPFTQVQLSGEFVLTLIVGAQLFIICLGFLTIIFLYTSLVLFCTQFFQGRTSLVGRFIFLFNVLIHSYTISQGRTTSLFYFVHHTYCYIHCFSSII